jgi:exportin-1
MIQAESDNVKRDEYLKRLMSLPNQVCSRLWHMFFLSVYIFKNIIIMTWLHFVFFMIS